MLPNCRWTQASSFHSKWDTGVGKGLSGVGAAPHPSPGERHEQTDPRTRLGTACRRTRGLGAGLGVTTFRPQNVGQCGEIEWFWGCVHALGSKSGKNSSRVPCEIPATSPPQPTLFWIQPGITATERQASICEGCYLVGAARKQQHETGPGGVQVNTPGDQGAARCTGSGNWAAAELGRG